MLSNTQKTTVGAFAALALGVALPFGIRYSPLLLNYTDSVPVGVYRQAKSGAAPYAGICLSRAVIDAALHGGLELITGNCSSGFAPILKPLLRPSSGRPLTYTVQGFSIGGNLLPNTAPKARSRAGVAIEHYRFGVYSSGAWAISDFNRDSYDSRYFGPVEPGTIRFYAKPVWIF